MLLTQIDTEKVVPAMICTATRAMTFSVSIYETGKRRNKLIRSIHPINVAVNNVSICRAGRVRHFREKLLKGDNT